MKATCTMCGKPFLFADERFGDRAEVRVKCPACQAVVTLHRPSPPAPAPPRSAAAASPKAVAPPASSGVLVDTAPPSIPAPPAEASPGREGPDGPPTLRVKRRSLVETGAQDEHMPPMPDGKRVSVAILSGPDSGKVLQCSVSRAVIGRTGSDLPIQDDEISRRHAVVETRDDRYFLKDLRSTNGTFVDERRITEVEIFDRSEFRVGTTTCMLIVAARDEL